MKLKKHPKFNIGLLILLLFINFNVVKAQDNNCKSLNFNLAPNYQTGPYANSFISADVNGDGVIDLITSHFSTKSISVLYGDGAGGFVPPQSFSTQVDVKALAVSDLNNDKKVDLIAADSYNNKIVILLNDGMGGFLAPTVVTLPVSIIEFNNLKAADFNGDGNLDIVGVARNNLVFLLGDGQGGLTLNTNLLWSGHRSEIAVGNFNNDGFADLAVTGGENANQFQYGTVLGKQEGNFSFDKIVFLTNRPKGIVTGDFNADNFTDIVFGANYPFQNSTPQTFYFQPFFGNGSGDFTSGTKVNLAYPIQTIISGDFNGDGKLDLAAGLGWMIATVNGNGDGTFQNLNYWTAPATQLISTDVNGDNRGDLLALEAANTNSLVSVLLSAGNDGFPVPKTYPYGDSDITAADFNNDGLLDMVTAADSSSTSEVVIALNDGNGGFLPDRIFQTPAALRSIAVGDFNGDGNEDVVTAHTYNGKQIAIYPGDGTGNLGTYISNTFALGVEQVITGDFNADGKDDLFIINSTPRGVVLLSKGDGTFSPAPEFSTDTINYSVTPLTGDFNKDGKLDLVVVGDSGVTIWVGVGDGTFTRGGSQPFSTSYGANIAAGDVNGDGNLDVITLNSSVDTTITRLFGDGNGGFSGTSTQTIVGQSYRIISADFNADGIDDLVLISSSNYGDLIVIPSSNQSPFREAPIYYLVTGLGDASESFASDLVAADYDADGKVDIGFTRLYRSRGVIYNTGGQNPCLSINDITVTEGDNGTTNAVLTVSLSEASSETVRVNYTLEGQTATIGTDLQNVSGRLEIPAGQTSATINVPINGDLVDEFDETFTVNLSSPSNAALGKAVGNGTITDDDAEPTLTVTDVAQNEPTSYQNFVFRVNLSAPSGKPISFRCANADGTATAGKDYIALNNTVSIQIGSTFAECYVAVIPDNIYEPDETFFLNISDATNASIADAQGEGKIINDDPIPTLNIYGNSVFEGDSGTKDAAVNIQLTNPSYLPITFHVLTSSGTATAGSDYVTSDTVVTVPAEQQTATANVRIIGDTINEPNETFFVNLYDAVNARLSVTQAQYLIIDDESVSNDYDGDGKTDFVVFRPNGGTWYTLFSSTNSFTGRQYGANTDLPVSGDYNGDGRADIAVFRSSNGTWYTPVPNRSHQWGTDGDIPVQGDYDNDGKTDLAVFRPSNGFWYIQQSSNNSFKYVQFGAKDDIPVPADYDGDGKTDVAVFRPSNNTWYVIRSSDNGFFASEFGIATDKPVPADYDGDGKADIAVFRDGLWYFLKSSEGNKFSYFQWGQAGDKPVPGNYDGDDKTDFAVYRKGSWYIYRSSDGSFLSKQFGASDDIPIAFVSNN